MLNLSIPEHIQPLRGRVLNFIEQEVYPVEKELTEDKVGSRRGDVMAGLMGLGFNGWCSMTDQFNLLHVWDTLIANAGRTTDNVGYRQSLWRMQLTDHSKAFTTNKRLPGAISSGKAALVLRPEVQQALRELDEATLTTELNGLLDKKSISALLSRRDALLSLAGQ